MNQCHDISYIKQIFFLEISRINIFLSKIEEAILELDLQTPLTHNFDSYAIEWSHVSGI
jgi:hypothetical protein